MNAINDDDDERAFIAGTSARNERELKTLVIALAFEIEDPCGENEIRLARALIRMARMVPPELRRAVAERIEGSCDLIAASQHRNQGTAPTKP